MADIDAIIEQLSNMSVLDLVKLSQALQEKWGVSAAPAMVAAPAASGAAAEAAAPVEEKTEFNVILQDFGANEINVIKVVRELTGLGLKEAKDVVEGAPKPIKENLSKEDAAKIEKQLTDGGAKVSVKP